MHDISRCLTRFKNAVITYPRLATLVRKLGDWAESWTQGVSTTPPSFQDPITAMTAANRDHVTKNVRKRIQRLAAIVDREESHLEQVRAPVSRTAKFGLKATSDQAMIAFLKVGYDPPGDARPNGPRHDNDHTDIGQIRIAPTHNELICTESPFLPANIPNGPHPFPPESMERLLDIQFRLLREELT